MNGSPKGICLCCVFASAPTSPELEAVSRITKHALCWIAGYAAAARASELGVAPIDFLCADHAEAFAAYIVEMRKPGKTTLFCMACEKNERAASSLLCSSCNRDRLVAAGQEQIGAQVTRRWIEDFSEEGWIAAAVTARRGG